MTNKKERNVPSMDNPLIAIVRDFKKSFKNESDFIKKYEKFMVKLEVGMEKELIKILKNVKINSSVKSDRYSLPIKYQILITQYGDSYINLAFNPEKVYRELVKRLLIDDVYKIRFYVFAEILDHHPMGKVNFYINYYY